MVVDLWVPEKSLSQIVSMKSRIVTVMTTRLVAVSPEEVLRSDVHIWVFCALLDRTLVRLVLPVLVPKTPCIYSCDAKGWDHDAA